MYRTSNLLCTENIIASYILNKRENSTEQKIPDISRSAYPVGI